MCVMILSERSSEVYVVPNECNCGNVDYLGLGRFRMRTFIYSPPSSLDGSGSQRQKARLLLSMSMVALHP